MSNDMSETFTLEQAEQLSAERRCRETGHNFGLPCTPPDSETPYEPTSVHCARCGKRWKLLGADADALGPQMTWEAYRIIDECLEWLIFRKKGPWEKAASVWKSMPLLLRRRGL